MSDIATIFDPVKGIFDWAINGPALLQDDGIATAVLLSLGCDKRANDTDTLPDDAIGPFGNGKKGSGDRRGWWGDFMTDAALDLQPGDHYPKPADRIGSWLWLFRRRKMTASLPGEIKAAAADALAWFVRDGIAKAVNLTAKAIDNQTILLTGEIVLVEGTPFRFLFPVTVGGSSQQLTDDSGIGDHGFLGGFTLNRDLLS